MPLFDGEIFNIPSQKIDSKLDGGEDSISVLRRPALWKAKRCGDAAALAAAPGINALAGGDAPLRFPGNAIPLSDRLASADDWLMAAGMSGIRPSAPEPRDGRAKERPAGEVNQWIFPFGLMRQNPATDAQKSAPPAK